MKTPEGWYTLLERNPASHYTLSVRVSYPNADDVKRSLAAGVITSEVGERLSAQIAAGEAPDQGTQLGGDIFIHGNPRSFVNDWTEGCISLSDREVRDVYRLADRGTPVLILPGVLDVAP